jgi:hypothetical protein
LLHQYPRTARSHELEASAAAMGRKIACSVETERCEKSLGAQLMADAEKYRHRNLDIALLLQILTLQGMLTATCLEDLISVVTT